MLQLLFDKKLDQSQECKKIFNYLCILEEFTGEESSVGKTVSFICEF